MLQYVVIALIVYVLTSQHAETKLKKLFLDFLDP